MRNDKRPPVVVTNYGRRPFYAQAGKQSFLKTPVGRPLLSTRQRGQIFTGTFVSAPSARTVCGDNKLILHLFDCIMRIATDFLEAGIQRSKQSTRLLTHSKARLLIHNRSGMQDGHPAFIQEQ